VVYKSVHPNRFLIYLRAGLTTTLAIRLTSRPTKGQLPMQLLSFSICFAVGLALHVVVAAPFPADNHAVNLQHGEPHLTAEQLESRIRRATTHKNECSEAASYHSNARDYHNAMAVQQHLTAAEREEHRQHSTTHNNAQRQSTKDARKYEREILGYRRRLEGPNAH
jgi:hypothetical protein